nr:maltotransferase domain-containing protein [Actinoplanes polyasparticus]
MANVALVFEHGELPAKSIPRERFEATAAVFREAHDALPGEA